MKKIAFAFIAASCLVFGVGHIASAQYASVTITPTQPTAGGAYQAVYNGCNVGDTIRFTQAQSTPATIDVPCLGTVSLTGSIVGLLLPQQIGGGTATANFTAAPTAPGTYNGTAVGTGQTPSPSQSFSFTIPGQVTTTTVPATTTPPPVTTAPPVTTVPPLVGGLPATGSGGIGTTTSIAIALLIVGVGLFVVAQVRRRQAPTTA